MTLDEAREKGLLVIKILLPSSYWVWDEELQAHRRHFDMPESVVAYCQEYANATCTTCADVINMVQMFFVNPGGGQPCTEALVAIPTISLH